MISAGIRAAQREDLNLKGNSFRNSSATKAQRRDMNYKTLSKREKSIAEKL